jgi:hypothetical protein
MLRKASFRYPSDVYALSFEKYKGSNNGEFLKDKNVLFIFILIFFCAASEWYSNNQNYEESRVDRAG